VQDGKQTVVIGPSIYRERMPFLPALVEQSLGAVQQQIFFDPQNADGRAEWASRLYGREISSAQFLGSETEFRDFARFAEHAAIAVIPISSSASDPVRFVMELLQSLGVPIGNLSAQQSQQLERDLGLLIQA